MLTQLRGANMWTGGNVSSLIEVENILSVLDESGDGYIFIYDMINDVYTISKKVMDTFDFDEYSFPDATNNLKKVIYEQDFPALEKNLSDIKNGISEVHDMEYRWYNRERKPVWIACKGKVVKNEVEHKLFLIGTVTEIGKKRKRDNLTSLLSESVMVERVNELSTHSDLEACVLLIGIDHFKQINDKYGTQLADEVLQELAECIAYFEDKDEGENGITVYKLHGDEFAVVKRLPKGKFTEKQIYDEAKHFYKMIRSKIDECIKRTEYRIFYTISGGAYRYQAGEKYDRIMHNAKFALNTAKKSGRNCCKVYSEVEYADFVRKSNIQDELRECIINDFKGFELYYQPIVNIRENTIYGAEALIRWTSKQYGFMSPVEFIPPLEETALIIPLGKWIIEQAVLKCMEWQKLVPDFVVNINLSFVQIKNSDILKDAVKIIDKYQLGHEHIVFEATESGELESSNVVKKVLESFNDTGFKLAIDDFGTGYSNLRYIKEKVFDLVKIDRMFIKDINEKQENYVLVKHITDMVHNLNLRVCFEGVETQEELETALQLAPDCIQGYYYGKPVSETEFNEKFINSCRTNV